MRPMLWLWLWLPLAAVGQTVGAAWTLPQLMQALAAVSRIDATFREQKELAIVQQPLVTTGVLRYRAPAYVSKQTLRPYLENYEINGDWLTLDTPTASRRQLYLTDYPMIHAFAEAIRATLAGDLPALQRYYQVQLQGQAAAWTLQLQPTEPTMAEHISLIVIRGQQERVLSMETLESDGDRSLMTVEPQNN